MRYDVLVRRRPSGSTTVYRQDSADLLEAIAASQDEHLKVWGDKGEVAYAAEHGALAPSAEPELDLVVYRTGLVHCSVCAPVAASPESVEAGVNLKNPTGVAPQWKLSGEATFSGGEPNPSPCGDHGDRLHYLMVC